MTARAVRSRLQVSYVKTGANTWSYEVTYQGDSAESSHRHNPIATGTMSFNADGTLATADTSAAAADRLDLRHHSVGSGDLGPHAADHLHQHGHGGKLQTA